MRFLIWVYICLHGECDCERIFYATSDRSLEIKSERSHYKLKFDHMVSQRIICMRQDTTYYYVSGGYKKDGFSLTISRVLNGKPSIKKRELLREELNITTRQECFGRIVGDGTVRQQDQ